MIPLHHSYSIMDALLENNDHRQIDLFEVDDYDHKTMPNFVSKYINDNS